MFDSGSILWDHPVEIFEVCRHLRVRSVEMSLRDAVETVRDTPEERRWALGGGLLANQTRRVGLRGLSSTRSTSHQIDAVTKAPRLLKI